MDNKWQELKRFVETEFNKVKEDKRVKEDWEEHYDCGCGWTLLTVLRKMEKLEKEMKEESNE